MRSRPLNGPMPAPLLILYATVSGNAEALAHAAAEQLGCGGYACVVANVADFTTARLREFDVALLIVSTWGEGVPPPEAEAFFSAVENPDLAMGHLRYAVLALGSSSYADFCAAGRWLDERLAERGAQRLLARVDCDTKFRADFQAWLARVEAVLKEAS